MATAAVAVSAFSCLATVVHAASNKVVIGDIDDMSGLYADVIGPGGVEAAKMAID
ncbi:MAG: ABC transporter permease, partial [Bradyrhizobium sp.]